MTTINRNTVAILGAVMTLMFASRMRSAHNYIVPDGVVFLGMDAWYHWRASLWTAANWPRTLGFDPWTGYPVGRYAGQFGTPWDILLGSIIAVTGGSDISMIAVSIVPPIIVALTAIPVYYIARICFGDKATIGAIIALALLPGMFYVRGLFGFIDHHAAEIFLQTIVVAGIIGALQNNNQSKIFVSLSSVALTLYIFIWPPGFYIVPILAVSIIVAGIVAFSQRTNVNLIFKPIYGIFIVPLIVVGVVGDWSTYSVTSISRLQIIALELSLVSIVLYHGILHYSRKSAIVTTGAPIIILSGIAAVIAWTNPQLFDIVTGGLQGHFIPSANSSSTIAEAQGVDISNTIIFTLSEYGLLVLVAVIAILFRIDRRRSSHIIVFIWGFVLMGMALTQIRYNYYAAVPIAIFAGAGAQYIVSFLTEHIDMSDIPSSTTIVIVFIIALAVAPASGSIIDERSPTDALEWRGALEYLEHDTPESAIHYTGYYERTDDYQYIDYGVLSWWDYGHWITSRAHRIAVANPFQQHMGEAAKYFVASNETEADAAIDTLNLSAEERIRYVVVDDRMATDKLWAIANSGGTDIDQYTDNDGYTNMYHESMVARLYMHDADRLEHHRLVYETPDTSVVAGIQRDDELILTPQSLTPDQIQTTIENEALELVQPRRLSTVKVFERVNGAVIADTTNADVVVVSVPLRTNTGRQFLYTQVATVSDGQFEARVPYATSGNTGSTVIAFEPYSIYADGEYIRSVHVSESSVQNGVHVNMTIPGEHYARDKE